MSLLIFKALHIVFAVSWFSGLFFWVRILIYHVEALEQKKNAQVIELLTLSATRIQSFVLVPAVIGTLSFGTGLTVLSRAYLAPWFYVKLGFVLMVIAYHLWAKGVSDRLIRDHVAMPSKYLRLFNEIPFILLLGIIFTAVFRSPTSGLFACSFFLIFVASVGGLLKWLKR